MEEHFDSYFEEENIFESINRFEEMVKTNSTGFFDVFEFEYIIDYYLDQHNYNHARSAIERGLKQHPCSSSLKLRLAQSYIQQGKPSKGLHFLRQIEGIENLNSDFHILKGTALNVLGRKEEAHKAFDSAIRLAQDDKDDIVYTIAFSYLNTRRYNLAIKYLLLAHEINPENLSVIHELALVYEKTEQLDKSIEFYTKFLDIDPFSEQIWFSLGMVYSSCDKFEEAIDAYDYAIAISPNYTTAIFSKGNTLVNSERYEEAIKAFEQIIFLEADNNQAFTYIGECYDKLEMYERAKFFYRKAIQIDKNSGDAWYGMGMSFYNMKDYSHSIQFFKRANKCDPENPDYWFMLGEAYKQLSVYEKSAESYNRAIELDPNDYEAWLSHADILFMEDKLIDAIKILHKAYEFNEDISTINYSLAAYYMYDDQPDLAQKYFEKALKINYGEHNELVNRFPIIMENEVFSGLIKKHNNLS